MGLYSSLINTEQGKGATCNKADYTPDDSIYSSQ